MTDKELNAVEQLITQALEEDIGSGDHTSLATIPAETTGKAGLLVKEDGVICGIPLAQQIFRKVDPGLEFIPHCRDGENVKSGKMAFFVKGSDRSILSAERVVLNFMQRLSGIATLTNRFVQKIRKYDSTILDTRKTTPLLRYLEKYAVRTGGGANHRMGLYDMILIKDNHIDFCGGIAKAIQLTQDYLKYNRLDLKIEIETRSPEEVDQVLINGGVHRIMMDNFGFEQQEAAVKKIAGRFETEASGNVRLDTVEKHAQTGVDFISSGALTHSALALDLSLKAID